MQPNQPTINGSNESTTPGDDNPAETVPIANASTDQSDASEAVGKRRTDRSTIAKTRVGS